MNIELRKARKAYKCDFSKRHIRVGDIYKRVNINYLGIFHFSKKVSDEKIKAFLNKNVKHSSIAGEFYFSNWDNDIY